MISFIVASVSNEVIREENRNFLEMQLPASISRLLLTLWRRYRMYQRRNQINSKVLRIKIMHFSPGRPGWLPTRVYLAKQRSVTISVVQNEVLSVKTQHPLRHTGPRICRRSPCKRRRQLSQWVYFGEYGGLTNHHAIKKVGIFSILWV